MQSILITCHLDVLSHQLLTRIKTSTSDIPKFTSSPTELYLLSDLKLLKYHAVSNFVCDTIIYFYINLLMQV